MKSKRNADDQYQSGVRSEAQIISMWHPNGASESGIDEITQACGSKGLGNFYPPFVDIFRYESDTTLQSLACETVPSCTWTIQ